PASRPVEAAGLSRPLRARPRSTTNRPAQRKRCGAGDREEVGRGSVGADAAADPYAQLKISGALIHFGARLSAPLRSRLVSRFSVRRTMPYPLCRAGICMIESAHSRGRNMPAPLNPKLEMAALDAFPVREPVSKRAYTCLRLR